MSTTDNLNAAFAGESQANRRYLAFAKKADADGFPQIARMFRAIAEAETIHAHAHLRVMGGVKTTAENLQAAIDGEAYEFIPSCIHTQIIVRGRQTSWSAPYHPQRADEDVCRARKDQGGH
jgi:hypothetical protein